MKGKVLITLLGAMAAVLSVTAAEYKPLLEEGKSWTCYYRGSNRSSDNPYMYGMGMTIFSLPFTAEVAGDTIVDGKQCWRIIRKSYSEYSSKQYIDEYILCEENETVSYLLDGDGHNAVFVPLMRFDVSVGDSICRYEENGTPLKELEMAIESIDTVVGSDGVERREVSISNSSWFNGNFSWVEGVGFSRGYDFILYPVSGQESYSEMDFKTIDCSINGESIFKKKDFKMQFEDDVEYESMFAPGKSWTMARGNEVFTVSVVGDTRVNGIPATKLIDSNGKEYSVIEDTQKVYCFFECNGTMRPLKNAVPLMNCYYKEGSSVYRYEFGQPCDWDDEKGDLTNRNKCRVRSVNTLMVNGVERKEWVVESKAGDVVASWVEGIGSPDAQSWVEMHMPADYDLRMIDCRQDGEVIFTAEDFSHQSGIAEVRADSTKRAGVYDLQGRRVATPGRGLYIIDGKKQLIR